MKSNARWLSAVLFLTTLAMAFLRGPAQAGLLPASDPNQALPRVSQSHVPRQIFQNAGTYVLGNGNERISGIAEGDFNGDGIVDLAVAASPNQGGEGSVTIFLGNGDGTFQPALASFDSGGLDVATISTADLNGDGKLDVVVGNFGSYPTEPGNLAVFLGNGDGSFTAGTTYLRTSYVSTLVLGDFNGGGTPDIAAGETYPTPTLNILLGKGDGTFRTGESLAIPSGVFNLMAADLNGDGNLDLILPFEAQGGVYSVELGKGNGTFGPQIFSRLPQGDNGVVTAITVGDFNNDGKPDTGFAEVELYCDGGSYGFVGVKLGLGTGHFGPALVRNSPDRCAYAGVVSGDFTGDGNLDLLAYNVDTFYLFPGLGNGRFGPEESQSALTSYSFVPAVGDLNNDGLPDVVAFSGTSFTVWLDTAGSNQSR
jgi:hypothetical protein